MKDIIVRIGQEKGYVTVDDAQLEKGSSMPFVARFWITDMAGNLRTVARYNAGKELNRVARQMARTESSRPFLTCDETLEVRAWYDQTPSVLFRGYYCDAEDPRLEFESEEMLEIDPEGKQWLFDSCILALRDSLGI